MAYRDNTSSKRPTAVFHYRPMHWLASGAIMLAILSMSLLTYWQAVSSLREMEISCERGGAHSCTIIRHYGPLTTHEVVPINAIHSVSVTSHSVKSGTKYATALVLKDGMEKLPLTRQGDRPAAEA